VRWSVIIPIGIEIGKMADARPISMSVVNLYSNFMQRLSRNAKYLTILSERLHLLRRRHVSRQQCECVLCSGLCERSIAVTSIGLHVCFA